MNVDQIQDRLQSLSKRLGRKAYIDFTIRPGGVNACVYTQGIGARADDPLAFRVGVAGSDPAAVLADLEASWLAEATKRQGRVVEDMALEIIRLTAELGECTDAGLRMRFGDAVATFADVAAARATEMAANGPFSVRRVAAANAA